MLSLSIINAIYADTYSVDILLLLKRIQTCCTGLDEKERMVKSKLICFFIIIVNFFNTKFWVSVAHGYM